MSEDRFKKNGRCLRKWATEGDKEILLGGFENPIRASCNYVIVYCSVAWDRRMKGGIWIHLGLRFCWASGGKNGSRCAGKK